MVSLNNPQQTQQDGFNLQLRSQTVSMRRYASADILPDWELPLPICVSRMHKYRTKISFTACFRAPGTMLAWRTATVLGHRAGTADRFT
jgi:hypothetical protein